MFRGSAYYGGERLRVLDRLRIYFEYIAVEHQEVGDRARGERASDTGQVGRERARPLCRRVRPLRRSGAPQGTSPQGVGRCVLASDGGVDA